MTWLSRQLIRFLLALVVLALFGGAVIVMSFFVVPEQNREVVVQLIGGINSLAGMVIGFYFGRADNPNEVKVTNDPAHPVPVDQGE
ncbi:hypothetical protein [Croceicoccus naphthovorans]|uniref:Uncharacterized protein n=1 Tax=Croceicoccus naphthovorans TaxID=1348774 RepID=A0A0G3XF98_9SPHN|nr:hypothetical protein [Croceicoccus naphthovorans]AKM09887.1 hypothetical protein AB433_07655 [Croceicoccus naphthovorans]MBB3991351.1 regulator of protease activity HflC (stomatin/prohibitin superfamily) [Croceicoccus naphthovorans]